MSKFILDTHMLCAQGSGSRQASMVKCTRRRARACPTLPKSSNTHCTSLDMQSKPINQNGRMVCVCVSVEEHRHTYSTMWPHAQCVTLLPRKHTTHSIFHSSFQVRSRNLNFLYDDGMHCAQQSILTMASEALLSFVPWWAAQCHHIFFEVVVHSLRL